MAHIEKYKAHSVGHMLAHYRRDPSSFERDNIDPTLTDRNLTLVLDDEGRASEGVARPNWDTVAARIAAVDAAAAAAGKRRTRKDAVVMADLVITKPENVPDTDSDLFFTTVYEWWGGRVGKDNCLGCFVHRDEIRTKKTDEGVVRTGEVVRDHAHMPFTPILDGRFNYKKMCDRTFYKQLHKDLGDHLEAQLGYRPEVELSFEKKGEKALSQVYDNDTLEAAKAAMERQEQRLECVRRDANELESLEAAGFREVARTAAAAGAGERIAELEREVRAARSRAEQLEREVFAVRERCRQIENAVVRLMECIQWVPDALSRFALAIADRLGLPVMSETEVMLSGHGVASDAIYRGRVERGEVPRAMEQKKVI